jgi:hypothetical protein
MRNIRISFLQKLKEKISALKTPPKIISEARPLPEIGSVNTPKSLGVTPRFVLQHNAISRSAHNFSATAKKLTAMAMSLLPADLSSLAASFTFTEFCKAIGYEKGGESYQIFTDAVKECMESVIKVETQPDNKGKTSWVMHHWFQLAKFDKDSGVCTMVFDQKLADFLKEMKRVYAKINLQDFGRLQSKYSLRYFEIARSYESLAGKDGNRADAWYFERPIVDLRRMLGVQPNAYLVTNDFKKKVVEQPVKELNGAGIGIEIKTEDIKRGRRLEGIRFNCAKTVRTTTSRRGRPRKQPAPTPAEELPEFGSETADSRAAKELQHLSELYPDEFVELYAAEMAKETKWTAADSAFKKQAAMIAVSTALRARHGVAK